MERMDASDVVVVTDDAAGTSIPDSAPFELAGRPYWCPVNLAIDALTGRWKTLILWQLVLHGTVRYGAIKRDVRGITHKMLAQSLRELEADGLVVRTVYAVVPPHVEYRLSDAGRELIPVLEAMERFGQRYAVPGAAS
jgi:DNA-binding HxlR family transcriptional regulator